jgi:TRAP-type C4-dicarboxylate transport system permease small subunit
MMETQASSARGAGAHRLIDQLEKVTTTLSKWLYWIAGAGLIAMLALVVADIVGIKALAHPIPGGIEITAFLGVVVFGFAIAFVQVLRGHIQVDFLVMKLPPGPKAIIEAIMTFCGIAFFIILAWRSWDYGRTMQLTGEVSMTQRIPFYPFIFGLAFCYLVTFLVLVVDFGKAIMKIGKTWTR